MPQTLHLIEEGHGFPIVLGHALGCDLSMWDEVAKILAKDFRVIRFDHLGHGQSPDILQGVRIEAFTDAVVTRLTKLNMKPYIYVGVSMGAMVGLDLATRYAHHCSGVVLANTTHYYDESARRMWATRIGAVTTNGLSSIADMAIERWVSPSFRADMPKVVEKLHATLIAMRPQNYAAACEAVSHIDFRAALEKLTTPALLISGDYDTATPASMLEYLHEHIASSKIKYLRAGHLSAVEQPSEFADAIEQFQKVLSAEL